MSGQWRLINTAPQHVKNVASIIDLRPGDDRLRTFADLARWPAPRQASAYLEWLAAARGCSIETAQARVDDHRAMLTAPIPAEPEPALL